MKFYLAYIACIIYKTAFVNLKKVFIKKEYLLVIFFLFGCLMSCNQSIEKNKSYSIDYLNPELDTEVRVADLTNRLTLDEKISQMGHNSTEISRLNIPKYNWWNECLHGVARAGIATVFPQPIGLAATFDTLLMFKIADAISDEARAKYHQAQSIGNHSQYMGLTFWSPNVNIFRDPRWGRGMETYGEDPYLTSVMGKAFVQGLQGNNPRYLKLAACAKHFVVHSGPEALRHEFNAVVNEKDLNETYLPAFKTLADANVESIMCAYNRTNDEACCGSKTLLIDLLRNKWKFQGHILSDCWALRDFHEGHQLTKSGVESAALALKAGVNLNCGDTYPKLIEAFNMGLVTENDINKSFKQLMATRFKLGMFDPDNLNPYSNISPEIIHCAEHVDLALEAAQKSIVLLKNKNVLPLKNDIKSLYVVGPHATNAEVLLGNYYGLSPNLKTILEGIVEQVHPGAQVNYKKGCMAYSNNNNPIDWTTEEAKEADAIIAVLGIDGQIEGEEGEAIASNFKGDRFDLKLPENQLIFLRKLRVNNNKPIIVVLTSGSPFIMNEIAELADAILFAWYPGEQGGIAVGQIIFGEINPSGKLPITFPESINQLPAYDNYSMQNRTYRYQDSLPRYPFGYGLTYSNVEISNLVSEKAINGIDSSLLIKGSLKNVSSIPVEEVLQVYISYPKTNYAQPKYTLIDFLRVKIKPGKETSFSFKLDSSKFISIDEEGKQVILNGDYKIFVSNSSPIANALPLENVVCKQIIVSNIVE